MAKRMWKFAALLLIVPSLAAAQNKMARPGPQRPGAGNPQIQPPRPGGSHGRPQRPNPGGLNPGRPNPGRPNPGRPNPGRPNPGRPDLGGSNPGRPNPGFIRPPHHGNRPGFHRPPNYRPNRYHYPRGYAYRRWHIGAVLPSILFGSTYYFSDYHLFGLYPPPAQYRWVRYGPDLILVNTRNGHIRDVRYGVFA